VIGTRTTFGYSETGFATIADSLSPKNYQNYKIEQDHISNSNLSANHTTQDFKDNLQAKMDRLSHISFEIKRDENLSPYDISFEDYQYLNDEALDIIFVKDSSKAQEANIVMNFATRSDDKILNKVFYDTMTQSKGEMNEIMRNMDFSVSLMQMQTNLHNNPNIEFVDSSLKREYIDTPHSAEDFFNAFIIFKESLNNSSYSNKYKIDSTLELMEDIKSEYEAKVKENEALLKELTKSTKPTSLENKNN